MDEASSSTRRHQGVTNGDVKCGERSNNDGQLKSIQIMKPCNGETMTRPMLEEEMQSELRRMTQIAPEIINHNVFTIANYVNNKFMQAQQQDASLIKYWEKARAGKGGFDIRDSILYKTKFTRIRSLNE